MLIIDQDKTLIVNFENVNLIGLPAKNDCTICSRSTNGDTQIIGEYKTQERAKEVLQEIYLTFGINKSIELFSNIGNMSQTNKNDMVYTPVYQMPKE